jgi:cellulose synthase/poly-beta-1,6-N-acetylglucosamine synthase-like glycosyltransferase
MLSENMFLLFKIACISGIIIIFFAYVGFPVCLILMSMLWEKFNPGVNTPTNDELPEIQVVVSCYNEAEIIEKRIANVLQQAYPKDKLSVLVISDGSSDSSDEIVLRISKDEHRVELFATGANLGKNDAINLAFNSGAFKQSLLCFTDADSKFEPSALASAARFFSSPRIGLVGGNIAYWLGSGSANRAEGWFWRIENPLRESEGKLGMLVSCTGLFILMRRDLFQPLPAEANTDFAMPLMVLAQGYESRFDKNAVVRSFFPAHQPEVFRRRNRTVIRALTTMAIYRKRLKWHLRLVLFWHKTARFYAFPVQVMVLLSNLFCQMALGTPFWAGLLFLQLIFYGAAVLGWLSEQLNWKIPLVFLPYQFTLQNALVFSSVICYLTGKRVAKWTPPRKK